MKKAKCYLISFFIFSLFILNYAQTKPQNNLIRKGSDGRIKAIYNIDLEISGKTIDEKAENFINCNLSQLGINSEKTTMKKGKTSKSLSGSHIGYQQMVNGIPVLGGNLLLSFNNNNQLKFLVNHFYQNINVSNSVVLEKDQAEEIAQFLFDKNTLAENLNDAKLYIVYLNDIFRYCWLVQLTFTDNLSSWVLFIDANSGEILDKRDITFYGTGKVFDPDPRTALSTMNIYDNSPDSVFNQVYSIVTLNNLIPENGLYRLRGSYAYSIDFIDRNPEDTLVIKSNPNDFVFNRTENGFGEVNCYFHLNRMREYIGGLGFDPRWDNESGSNSQAIAFDALAGFAAAGYYPTYDRIGYGAPATGVDYAEDQSAIIHEYGHALHDALISDPNGLQYANDDTQGISQGIAAYLGVSYRRGLLNGTTFQPNLGFCWVNPGTTIYDSINYNYSTALSWTGSNLGKMYVWASTLMNMEYQSATNPGSGPRLGRDVVTTLVLESFSYVDASSDAIDNVNAILQADQEIYGGSHISALQDVFVAWGFLHRGTISSNVSWRGNLVTQVIGDLTIQQGASLSTGINSDISFVNNSKLIVEGNLSTYNNNYYTTYFDFISPGTLNNQNGIFISSSGSASITHCDISNAYKGISLTTSTTNTIENNSIHNNTVGVYCYNLGTTSMSFYNNEVYSNSYDGFYLNGSSPDLSYNKIHNNDRDGINCYNASPVIYHNQIYSNNSDSNTNHGGVYCDNQSCAMFGQYGDGEGHNIITLNTGRGIYAKTNSNIFLGSGSGTGINSVYSNSSYELETYNTSAISAEKNWWGYPFSTGEFNAQNSSIDWDPLVASPYPTTDPNGGLSKSNSIEESISESENYSGVFDDELKQALNQQLNNNFSDAIDLYSNILNNSVSENMTTKQSDKSIFALQYLSNCYERSGRTNFNEYLNTNFKTINSNSVMYPVISKLKTYWLIKEKKFEDALLVLDVLIQKYSSDNEIVKQSLFDKGCIYFVQLNDEQKAKEQFAKLESLFPQDDLVIDSKLLLGEVVPKIKGTENSQGTSKELYENAISLSTEIPTEYSLSGNYPNPFNPTTIIKYALPVESKVELKIYDLLGREVRMLINGNNNLGYKEVVWDGKNDAGIQVSSGIYLYRLVAKSLEDGKVFEKSAKMIMMK